MSLTMKSLLCMLFVCFQVLCSAEPVHLAVKHRKNPPISAVDRARNLRLKYGIKTNTTTNIAGRAASRPPIRRGTSNSISITDHKHDISYFTSLTVGTPPQTLNVILDTGSSDFWVAGNECTGSEGCNPSTPLFDISRSTSFQGGTPSTELDPPTIGAITEVDYGSGAVAGAVCQDTATLGGFTVSNQLFLDVAEVQGNITDTEISGLMGLAWPSLAQTATTPFWLTITPQLAAPEFSFFLARSPLNLDNDDDVSGSVFTLGGTNSKFFTGDIEFLNLEIIPTGSQATYWTLALTTITVNGQSAPVSSDGSVAVVAIDTGTSLISTTADNAAAFWAQVPGSQPSSDEQGFFTYPCSTQLEVSLSFGGKSWPISPEDMNIGQDPANPSQCLGSVFDGGLTSDSPTTWIIGDTFLKNVYSVFRSSPPSVGFAQLSTSASSGSGSSSSSSSTRQSGASKLNYRQTSATLSAALTFMGLITFFV